MSILSLILMSIMIMLIIPKTASYIMGGYKSFFTTIWRFIPKIFRGVFLFFELLFKGLKSLYDFIVKEISDMRENYHNRL